MVKNKSVTRPGLTPAQQQALNQRKPTQKNLEGSLNKVSPPHKKHQTLFLNKNPQTSKEKAFRARSKKTILGTLFVYISVLIKILSNNLRHLNHIPPVIRQVHNPNSHLKHITQQLLINHILRRPSLNQRPIFN